MAKYSIIFTYSGVLQKEGENGWSPLGTFHSSINTLLDCDNDEEAIKEMQILERMNSDDLEDIILREQARNE